MTILNDIVENTREKLIQKKEALSLNDIKTRLGELSLSKGAFMGPFGFTAP